MAATRRARRETRDERFARGSTRRPPSVGAVGSSTIGRARWVLEPGRPFRGRAPRHDEEVARRTQAAVDWLHDSFRVAMAADAAAVVVALHANPLYEPERAAFAMIHGALVELASELGMPTLVIHGDEHQYTLDRPFRDPVTGAAIANLQRLETFGSPDIGWVDVVVDTSLAEPFRFEPNVTPHWMWW
jgi:hypothetical protein